MKVQKGSSKNKNCTQIINERYGSDTMLVKYLEKNSMRKNSIRKEFLSSLPSTIF